MRPEPEKNRHDDDTDDTIDLDELAEWEQELLSAHYRFEADRRRRDRDE